MTGDVIQLAPSTNLTVGNVEKVGFAGEFANRAPGVDVGGVIGAVTRIGLEVDRHRAITGERQAEDDLFQVGSVVLAVTNEQTEVHHERHPASDLSF